MNTHVDIDTLLMASFGPALAGLTTVGYTIKNGDGSTRVARTTTGVMDVGDGDYAVQYTPDTPFDGWVSWDTGGGSPVYAREEILVEPDLEMPQGGQIAYLGPVAPGGDATIVHGDDYDEDEGRSLEWMESADAWPTLTGGSAFLNVFDANDTELLHVAMTIVTATGANKKVRAELTAVQTAQLQAGKNNRFAVIVVLSGRTVTLAQGTLHVLPRST